MKPDPQSLERREFLKTSTLAGAGLVVAFYLPGDAAADDAGFQPNAWLQVAPNDDVTLWVAKSELGQGSHTGLAMILADELDADWQRVTVARAVLDPKYGFQGTGGSTAIRTSWTRLRNAAAAGRAMLIAAAAQQWGVPASSCTTEPGFVIHKESGRRAAYGSLALAAAKFPVPEKPPLKDAKDFRYIGKPLARVDIPAKLRGTAEYGIDVRRPGMLYGTVVHCPVFGGKPLSANAAVHAKPGVKQVVMLPHTVGVVADSTWHAFEAAKALDVRWDEGPNANLGMTAIRAEMEAALKRPAKLRRNDGDAEAAFAAAEHKIDAVYELPYLPHAPLEPMNCTVEPHADGAEVWAPTQFPNMVQGAVAEALQLPPGKVKVNITYSGGAFGRRILPDFASEAAALAKAAAAPVKLTWTRAEDMQHDFYRPASLHRVAGALNKDGWPNVWIHRVVCPSIGQYVEGGSGEDDDISTGAVDLPYGFDNIRVEQVTLQSAVPLGWCRSVYDSQTAYVNEHFFDELAALAGKDPLELRRMLTAERYPHQRAVLQLVADKSGWGSPLPEGHTRGAAVHYSFTSTVAHVAEVSVESNGRVRVHRVVTAVECGTAVNPRLIEQQMQGAVALGLTAFFKGPVTVERGRVQQENYDGYPLLTMDEMPSVEVHIVPSSEAPRGIGEPGVPPIAPAVANAIFAATKKPIRKVPYVSG